MKLSRRRFMKYAAASSAVATAGSLFPGISFGNWRQLSGNSGIVSWQKAPCRFCGTGCGVLVGVSDGRAIAVKGDPSCSVNKGLCCVKGYHSIQSLYGEDRLKKALIRKNGVLVESDLDEALDLIAEKFSNSKGDKFAALASARITNEDNYLIQKFTRAVMGTNNIDHCARL